MSTPTDTSGDTTPIEVTPNVLRDWPLPSPGPSKYDRGQVVVIGGAERSPGAAMLSGVAALRMGAGRLSLAVSESVAVAVAVAIPECGVVPLVGSDLGGATADIESADAVLLGPGLDDADVAEGMLRALLPLVGSSTVVALDAYALGVAAHVPEITEQLAGRLVLTPNLAEAARLLDREVDNEDNPASTVVELAERYRAVVSCQGYVASDDGRVWSIGTGRVGLATSGSGDVLAGAILGLCARGADPTQAAVWATYAHAASGDRLAVRVGPLGFLAGELLAELPSVLVEVGL
jgi:ADP-dependent NAD(P)H-hydrate dehydratase